MFRFAVLLGLLTGGCATGADIYRAGVDETVVIAKPLVDVSRCMALQLGSAPVAEPDGGIFFLKGGYGETLALFTLSPIPAGTQVEIRRRGKTVSTGMWRKCR